MCSVRKSLFRSCICLVLVCNYFAFQVELFDDEYDANHPKLPDFCSFAKPGLTWESFDKDNAPKAFVVDAHIRIAWFFVLPPPDMLQMPPEPPFQPVRDKSPPCTSSSPFQVSIA